MEEVDFFLHTASGEGRASRLRRMDISSNRERGIQDEEGRFGADPSTPSLDKLEDARVMFMAGIVGEVLGFRVVASRLQTSPFATVHHLRHDGVGNRTGLPEMCT
jgi:hypothetical protein